MATAGINGLNIGVRHVLPLYTLAAVIAGAGVAALAPLSRGWKWACGVLVAAHFVSALSVFPNSMAFANEAWGGPRNVHKVLNDSNVDWGQQLYQVRDWEDRHPGEECWFAYFARPMILQETFEIHCHVLPNGMAMVLGLGAKEPSPPIVHGAVLLSASEVNGAIWPSKEMNPYHTFQTLKPDEEIDNGILVYRGDVHVEATGAISRAFLARTKLQANQPQEALALAEEAVKLAPGHLYAEWALGDASAAAGKKDEARAAYQAAIAATSGLDPQRQADNVKDLEAAIKKL
jgi:tetratricopeptide (TPR) repeat protein